MNNLLILSCKWYINTLTNKAQCLDNKVNINTFDNTLQKLAYFCYRVKFSFNKF